MSRLVDQTKRYLFIWVPGTGGHAPHPSFEEAVHKQTSPDYQLFHVEYPASYDFYTSVPAGEEALKALLRRVNKEKSPEQLVLLGGSSQGSWVISNVLGVPSDDGIHYLDLLHKAVLFGHPGVSDYHFHEHGHQKIWEINNPKDAVTYGWGDNSKDLILALSQLQRGYILCGLPRLTWAFLRHPITSLKLGYLLLHHKGYIPWEDSPHDYSLQMPLAVFWLTN